MLNQLVCNKYKTKSHFKQVEQTSKVPPASKDKEHYLSLDLGPPLVNQISQKSICQWALHSRSAHRCDQYTMQGLQNSKQTTKKIGKKIHNTKK